MKSVGIISEYNPFHYGHLFHMEEAKKKADADIVIVAMSGHFLQRGEPAVVSKWARAEMALMAGADIVIEIPYSFAVQKAETFALGAVYLLDALECDSICFGSESGEIAPFLNTADLLEQNKEAYNRSVRHYMKQGVSYPKALSLAYTELDSDVKTVDLSRPNNILGYHYITAARAIQSSIDFLTVKRNKAEHNDQTIHDKKIASATSIRNLLFASSNWREIAPFVPAWTLNGMQSYKEAFSDFHNWEDYWPFLQFRLLTMNSDELLHMYDIEEGLPYRLQKAALNAQNFQAFMEEVKTKRYTWTRLQRICTHALTGTNAADMNEAGTYPHYIRLLGMSAQGRLYLNGIKKNLALPLVSTLSSFPASMTSLERKATLVYAQALKEPYRTKLSLMDYNRPPIMTE